MTRILLQDLGEVMPKRPSGFKGPKTTAGQDKGRILGHKSRKVQDPAAESQESEAKRITNRNKEDKTS